MNSVGGGFSPVAKRALMVGIVVGAVLGIVVVMVRIYPSYLMFLPFLVVVGVASYKYVGNAVSGVVVGLTTFVVNELVSSVFWGIVPFSELQYLSWPGVAEQVLVVYAIGFIGFPAAGFISGRVCERRGISRVMSTDSLTDLESKVLSYIQAHNNQIQITDCALELGTDSKSVKKALNMLEKKGKLLV